MGQRHHVVDTLRAIAALWVCLYHSAAQSPRSFARCSSAVLIHCPTVGRFVGASLGASSGPGCSRSRLPPGLPATSSPRSRRLTYFSSPCLLLVSVGVAAPPPGTSPGRAASDAVGPSTEPECGTDNLLAGKLPADQLEILGQFLARHGWHSWRGRHAVGRSGCADLHQLLRIACLRPWPRPHGRRPLCPIRRKRYLSNPRISGRRARHLPGRRDRRKRVRARPWLA
jgi:hypothetical protein